jgi:hypothetical protein
MLTTRLFDFESARVSDKEVERTFPLIFLEGLRLRPDSETGRR